jgi:uncharacterized membrane protein YGL010W
MQLTGVYDEHHKHPINRLMHFLAIPLGFSSIITVWFHPLIALLQIPAAFALAILGHKIEGNEPAFIKDPRQIFVAPLWIFKTVLEKVHPPNK